MGKVATTAQTKGRVKSAMRPKVAKRSQKILRCMGRSLTQALTSKSTARNGCATRVLGDPFLRQGKPEGRRYICKGKLRGRRKPRPYKFLRLAGPSGLRVNWKPALPKQEQPKKAA